LKLVFKTIVIYLAVLTSAHSAFSEGYTLDSGAKNGESVKFIKYKGPGRFETYLAMNLPYEPVKDLFLQVEVQSPVSLRNRGEAHITVVTPLEYFDVLAPRGDSDEERSRAVTIEEIDRIAIEEGIQSSDFEVVCLGQGVATINNKEESTYYVVVASENLIKIRQRIQDLFVSRGGEASAFVPSNFYPHITLGFTKRDLHESDGIIKDSRTCISPIELTYFR
jgi:2'-5' RNA ligase